MAGELQTRHTTGATVYFHVRSTTGTIWNGSALETYSTANIANYKIAATEQGTASTYYIASMPAAAAGAYSITSFAQVGGSPAESDTFIRLSELQWAGTVTL